MRDIGGIIIVDFIDMDDKGHQQELYDYVRKLMERDRAKHNVLPLSKFGLMQITRQRVRPAVEVEVMETCPTCMGKGKIQPSILFTDQIAEMCEHMHEQYGRGLKLHLHPYVYAYVSRGWLFSLKAKWQLQYGVKVVENQSLGMLEMRFMDANGKVVQHKHEEPKEEKKDDPKPEPKVEQPKQVEQPKPVEKPKQVEQPKPVEKPKSVEEKPKVEQPKPVELPQEEEAPKKKTARRSAKKAAKPAPVEPAEKSPAETKAPTAVKKRARRKKAENAESKQKTETV